MCDQIIQSNEASIENYSSSEQSMSSPFSSPKKSNRFMSTSSNQHLHSQQQRSFEPDFQGAYDEVHTLLTTKLDPRLLYHGSEHTFSEVVPAAIRLAEWENLSTEDTIIVKTAALFHDTGFVDQYDKNEPFGCKRARETLPKYGYSLSQIERICECIMATQMPQSPKGNLLAEILCDADLAYLGTDNVFLRSECLRLELNAVKNLSLSPKEWNKISLNFVKSHSYWTKSANEKLKPVKDVHIEEMMDLVYTNESSSQQ